MSLTQDSGFLDIARQRSVVIRAIRIAAVVGVVLAMINHGDRLFSGQVDTLTAFKIALTFLVPYCVSTFSSVMAVRERLQTVEPANKQS